MARITERFRHPEARFVGFDSFEGLPEDWVQPWETQPRGTYSTGGKIPNISDQRAKFIKGWFQDTLPDFLAARPIQPSGSTLVHYDADLYSSTLFILATLWNNVPEYYFIFDEFMGEELIALHDFSGAFPVEIEFICQTNKGSYPAQIFGRLRRVPFTL